jgi:hypothetical protein
MRQDFRIFRIYMMYLVIPVNPEILSNVLL